MKKWRYSFQLVNTTADEEEMVTDQNENIAGYQHPKTIELGNLYHHAHEFVQMTWCKDTDYWLDAKLFPHLYPIGSGSWVRHKKLSLMDFSEMRLLNYDPRFRRDKYYQFWLLNRILNDKILKYNKATIKCADPEQIKIKTVSDLKQDREKPLSKQAGVRLPTKLPGSRNYYREATKDLRSMCLEIGDPTFFITITQNDGAADLQAIVKENKPGAKPPQYDYLNQPIRRSGKPVVDMPTEAVLRMNRFINGFKQRFIRNKVNNPFGDVHEFFIRTEYQKRGALHYHILLWSKEGSYDNVISAEVPRSTIPIPVTDRMREYVLKYQIHNCGPICFKESNIKTKRSKKSKKMDSDHCRNGFPFHLCEEESEDINGRRILYVRRQEEDRKVVPYNMELLAYAQCHINVQRVNKHMLLEYLTKYVTKPEPLAM